MKHDPLTQVVNDKDEPVGGKPIQEVYDNQLTHRIVYIAVKDNSGLVLLQKRSATQVTQPNRWDISAAGHVDLDESYELAAKRELAEEVGIDGVELTEIGRSYKDSPINGRTQRRFLRFYKATVPNGTQTTIDQQEVSDVQWLSLGEVRQLLEAHPEEIADGLIEYLKLMSEEQK